MDMGFAVRCPLARRGTPRIRFLFIGSRVCSTLPSDPASRRRPCASLSLHLHQVGRGLPPPSCRTCSAHIDIGRRLPAFPVPPPCVRVTYTAVRRVELPLKREAGRSAPKRRPGRFGPSGQSLGASPLLAAREARHYWRFCRHPLRRRMDLLATLTVWAFLPRRRGSTIPSADFCRRGQEASRPPQSRRRDTRQISRGKLDRLPRTTAGSTLCALDGYGLRDTDARSPDAHASYPVFVHRLALLLPASFRPRLAATPLRFANPSPPSGWVEDFHLQAVEHARHTSSRQGALRPPASHTTVRAVRHTAVHEEHARRWCSVRRLTRPIACSTRVGTAAFM